MKAFVVATLVALSVALSGCDDKPKKLSKPEVEKLCAHLQGTLDKVSDTLWYCKLKNDHILTYKF